MSAPPNNLTLRLHEEDFAICRLPSQESIPPWASIGAFVSVSRTTDELSIFCPAQNVPQGVKYEANWRLFQLRGPFPFTAVGILASVLSPLAEAKVSILAFSTFDTDYIAVKQAQLSDAIQALETAGHIVQSP